MAVGLAALLAGRPERFVDLTARAYRRLPRARKKVFPRRLRAAYAYRNKPRKVVPIVGLRPVLRRPPEMVLHIGLPKTGTTFLQKRIFAEQWEVPYFGKHSKVQFPLNDELWRIFRKEPAEYWATYEEISRQQVESAVDGLPYRWRDVVLCSNENYFTSTTNIARGGGELDPDRVAEHLRAFKTHFWPDAPLRVVVGIRRQDQWLASNYAEQAFRHEMSGQADFEKKMKRLLNPGHRPSWLDFSVLVRRIQTVVGCENVSVLPMEELVEDPETAVRRIEAFVGHSLRGPEAPDLARRENVKAVAENCWKLNTRRIRKPKLVAASKSVERERQIMLPDELSAQILEVCREGNEALEYLLGRDLSRFGYTGGYRSGRNLARDIAVGAGAG